MHIESESNLRKTLQSLAGSIAFLVAIFIPVEHLYTGYTYLTETSQFKARYVANDLSEFVFSNPDTWSYQEHRYSAIIEKYADFNKDVISLLDNSNEVIYSTNNNVEPPTLRVTETIYDASKVVADLHIEVSFKPLLIETVYTSLASLILGIIIFLTLYLLPIRALNSALDKLKDSRSTLEAEIKDKEKALQEAHEMGQKLHQMAMHDSLTGLPNRSMFKDRLSQALLLAERQKLILAVVMIDLNRFKEVNDSLGHHAGDSLLLEIANRIQSSTRKCDTVARLGGDEFALILHVDNKNNAIDICSKLSDVIKTSVWLDQLKLEVDASASFGIAYYPEDSAEPAALLQKADIAMYVAKKTSNNISIYDKNKDTNSPEKLQLINQMNQAISKNELFLVYQPKVNLQTSKTIGVEALVRWQHPENGLINPGLFIPLAETSEFIHPLTEWVIDTALKEQSNWRKIGVDLDISVNISAKNLRDDKLQHKISTMIKKWDSNPNSIILEITESAMIENPERAQAILQEISEQGIRLSIDDFGTGHASLIQLKTFPFNELKIDRSFIKDMIIDTNDAAIVRSAIALSKSLNMTTVAEGIEDERIINLLKEMDCDLAQGFFLCKPLTSKNLITWLNEQNY